MKQKKVLLIGPNFFHYIDSIETALKKNGYEVNKVLYNESPIGIIERFLSIVLRSLTRRIKVRKFNKYLEGVFDSYCPDAVVVIKGNLIAKTTLIKWSSIPRVLWMMDSIFSYKSTLDSAKYYSHIFCFENTDVEKLEKIGIFAKFLPLGVDENIFYPCTVFDKDIDVLFVGTLYKTRKKYFDKLLLEHKNINIKVIGPLADRKHRILNYLGLCINDARMEYRNVNTDELVELYSRSRIIINMHHAQSIYGVNPRFFEIIACDSFQIVDKMPFIEDFFSGYDIVQYRDLSELTYMLESFANGEVTWFVNKDLREFVLREHTMYNRVCKIIDELN